GPTGTGSGWTSAARASRWTTVTLKPSTEACGVSACRNIGSWTWTTPERSSPAGGRTTTTFDPTAAWVIFRPSTSGLAEPSPPPPRGSKTHPRSGPKLGGGADRLLHHVHLVHIDGRSYRLRELDRLLEPQAPGASPPPERGGEIKKT